MEKEKPDQLGYTVIPCSRWEPVSFYLSTDHTKLNDIPIVYNEKYFDQLVNSGVDPQLARLVSRSLTRDPLFVSEKQLEEDETETFNLLIALLSTTFPTVRLKIPDASNSAFWRLEFRPMEVQFTDYENAAFSLFMVILAKIILEKKLHLLIPISKVLENVERAQKRDAVRNEKFWMKSNFQDDDSGWEELTVDEVINGKDPDHVGLVSVIRQYMSETGVDNNVAESLERYLRLVQGRASGELMTDSRWIREFVTSHDDYKHDSYITDKINYDLLLTIDKIQRKEISCSQLLGE
ncbi:glutamate--cysteine ligase-like [Tachypleus tridentatus]|uniref:glutamate--cysteine ligase-like n=1 Tax=Tachypleus tridentatus TaxID=6853 RepID=UPI003FD0098D